MIRWRAGSSEWSRFAGSSTWGDDVPGQRPGQFLPALGVVLGEGHRVGRQTGSPFVLADRREEAVDASMSSGERVLGDVVVPGLAVGGHCMVDDVDEVALEDAAGSACSLGGLVAG